MVSSASKKAVNVECKDRRERKIDRRRVKGRLKITKRETTAEYGRCSRSHGIVSGSLLAVALYPSLAGMSKGM